MNSSPIISLRFSLTYRYKFVDLIEGKNQYGARYFLKCMKGNYWVDKYDDNGNSKSLPRDFSIPLDDDENWTVPIRDIEVKNILERLENCSINTEYTDSEIIGCDGRSYFIKFRDFFDNKDFVWWMNAPLEWKVLEDIVRFLNNTAGFGFTFD